MKRFFYQLGVLTSFGVSLFTLVAEIIYGGVHTEFWWERAIELPTIAGLIIYGAIEWIMKELRELKRFV